MFFELLSGKRFHLSRICNTNTSSISVGCSSWPLSHLKASITLAKIFNVLVGEKTLVPVLALILGATLNPVMSTKEPR